MRRRLDLALSLIVAPAVLFLDEPTTGLDTRSRQELWSVIRSLAGAGTTVFLTTQYLEEADRLADRIAVLDGGRVAAEGTPDELKARIGGDVVELRDADGALLLELPTDGSVHGLRAAMDELDRTPAAAADGVAVSIRRPSLDDVFLAITARDAAPASPELHGSEVTTMTTTRPCVRPRIGAFTAESTFITRSFLHSSATSSRRSWPSCCP